MALFVKTCGDACNAPFVLWQKLAVLRSKAPELPGRNAPVGGSFRWRTDRSPEMTGDKQDKVPPAVLSGDPEEALEEKLRRNPNDLDTKADVASDESMDASDPPSPARSGDDDDPVPSSGFPE
jgi:hypothetical protein